MASTAAAAKQVPAEAGAPPKKSKLMLIVAILVVLLAGGGAAAWYFMSAGAEDEEHDKPAATKPAIFVPLEQFTVNLQPEDGPQFLQTAMTLKVVDSAAADAIKTHMPEIRSRILLLLSSKKPSQVSTPEGKHKLADELADEVEAPLPPLKGRSAKRKGRDADEEEEDEKPKSKKDKSKDKAKAKAKAKAPETKDAEQRRVSAVFFTHFIIQ